MEKHTSADELNQQRAREYRAREYRATLLVKSTQLPDPLSSLPVGWLNEESGMVSQT